ncbi:hypothetical protein WICMUC_005899 [Wickerhamomyces mucosus]|uniref:Uncharacterized protein n=1 Tax=Wickerhamomyces mucosus TaxID=1378264 RepID=A0A9P8P2K1_9ASCO|nr:hypothetical protein WICMUC_005899 [Wickerhamomyces mucosus]
MSKFHRYFRASLTQAFIVGLVSFTQPGIWSAIAGLGAGGLQKTTTANIASAITYGLMFILAPFCAIFINKKGVKPAILIGTIGYVFYSAGLYLNSKTGAQWLIILGAITTAISASFLWVAEAVVVLNYSTDGSKGAFVGIWQGLNKFGGILSGSISLALNHNSQHSGGVSLNTYIALIAVQCLGLPIALLLAKPEQIYRNDGKKFKTNIISDSFIQSFNKWKNTFKKRQILLLLPIIITNLWYGPWYSNYMTRHFSVRSRTLNSLLTALIGLTVDIIMGIFLDLKIKKSLRARSTFLLSITIFTIQYIYGFHMEFYFQKNPKKGLDWNDGDEFIKAFLPFQICKIATEIMFNWLDWIIGSLNFEPSEVVYVSAIIRAFESLGECFSFIIGSVVFNNTINLAITAGVFWLAIPFGLYVAFNVSDDELDTNLINEEEGEEEESLDDIESEIEQVDIIVEEFKK